MEVAAAGSGVVAENATAAEPKEETRDSAANTEAKEDVSSLFRKHKHKVKVDGQEQDIDYDDLVRDYQTRKSADKRFREASELSKKAEKERREAEESFKKDPWSYFKKHNLDPYKLAENLLIDKLEYENLSESDRRALIAEQRAKELEAQIESEKSGREKMLRQQAEEKALQEIDAEIGEALKAMGRKPTPRFIARIAETLLAHHESQQAALAEKYGDSIPDEAWGFVKKLSAKDAVERVKKEYHSDIAELFSSMSLDELRELLPKDKIEELRKADVQRVLSQDPIGSRKPNNVEPRRAPIKDKRMSTDDFFSKMDKKLGVR